MPRPTETEKRIAQLEAENKQNRAAINGLARLETRLAAIKPGVCPELDAIRAELAGSIIPGGQERLILETRPHHAPEQRVKAVV
jgi:hypothetical protein